MSRTLSISSQTRLIRLDKTKLKALIHTLDTYWEDTGHWGDGAFGITFVSHDHLAQMHGDFCGDPTPTDIITFPYYGEEGQWGELYISPQAAINFIQKKHPRLKTASASFAKAFDLELTRYVIHGYLHLLGYDDLTPKGRAQMRRLELKSLSVCQKIRNLFQLSAHKA